MTSLRGFGPPDHRDISGDDDDHYAKWDAAYVLGSLSAGDRREFETHLAHCPACRGAIAELSAVPALLAQLDRNESAAIMTTTTHPRSRCCRRRCCHPCWRPCAGAATVPG